MEKTGHCLEVNSHVVNPYKDWNFWKTICDSKFFFWRISLHLVTPDSVQLLSPVVLLRRVTSLPSLTHVLLITRYLLRSQYFLMYQTALLEKTKNFGAVSMSLSLLTCTGASYMYINVAHLSFAL